MHVAYISMAYPRDESSVARIFERRLVYHLKDLCDISILTLSEDPNLDEYYIDGVKVKTIKIEPYARIQRLYDTNQGFAGNILNFVRDRRIFHRTWKALKKLHARKKIDAIFVASFSQFAIYSLLFARIHRIPILTQCTGYDVDVLPEINYGIRLKWGREKLYSVLACKYVDVLLPNSQGIYEDTFLRDIKDRVRVLFQGVEIDKFKRTTRKKLKHDGELMVLNVGGLEKVKGWVDIVETARILKGRKIKFVIIGSDADISKFNELIKKYKLNNIEFKGKVPPNKIKKYYEKTDIFFFPSKSEGLPNALLEAAAMEVPLIGSGRGGTRDVIKDNYNGYYLKKGDPEAFAKKIIYLAENPSLRLKMGSNARKHVKQYQWYMCAENLIKIINDVLSKRQKGN